jgi:anti-sigma-K factor RskA
MSGSFDFDPPDDDMEMLAAEYALGLLTVAQLPHVVAQRQGSARFDNAVNQWEAILLPLTEEVQPVEPPARLWPAIAAAIAPVPKARGIWDNARFWRSFGIGAGLVGAGLAVALVAVLRTQVPAPPVATATLVSQHEGVFVATAEQTNAGIQLVINPAQVVVPGGKSAELWLITPGNKPAPLGLLASDRPVTLTIPTAQLNGNIALAKLAVSIEPAGGSPSGQPTGPKISVALHPSPYMPVALLSEQFRNEGSWVAW